jgi:hypothetical protein
VFPCLPGWHHYDGAGFVTDAKTRIWIGTEVSIVTILYKEIILKCSENTVEKRVNIMLPRHAITTESVIVSLHNKDIKWKKQKRTSFISDMMDPFNTRATANRALYRVFWSLLPPSLSYRIIFLLRWKFWAEVFTAKMRVIVRRLARIACSNFDLMGH